MGRWSQQRRRGGGPAAAAAPLPRVVQVVWDATGGVYDLQFDQDIVYDGSGNLDAFDIDGDTVAVCTQLTPRIYTLVMSSISGPAGTWAFSGQSSNILTPIFQPDSGPVL